MQSLIFHVIQRALDGADTIPPAERADLYQGISECLAHKFPAEALAAQATADQIREAETRQCQFLDLLSLKTA